MDVAIRPARQEDLDALVDLSRRWEAERITYGLKTDSRRYFEEHLGALCLVADRRGKTIGYAVGALGEADESLSSVMAVGTEYLDVLDLYVAPAYRSQGVGSLLVENLRQVAEDQGARCSILSTMTKDQKRITAFYDRLGFIPYRTSMVRYGMEDAP